MNLIVVKRFITNSVLKVVVVVFRVHSEWENIYVVSSPKYSNMAASQYRQLLWSSHKVP